MQAAYIFLVIIIGILIPGGQIFTFLIRYNLMVMLFFSFLGISFHWELIRRHHFVILLVNLIIPLILFRLLLPVNAMLAYTTFVVGIAPTAVVAPVISDFLKGNSSFVTMAVLITNPAIAIILPFLLPFVISTNHPIQVSEVLLPVSIVILGPLLLSEFIKRLRSSWVSTILRLKRISFYLFLFNVFIASAKASHYIRNDQETVWYSFVLMGFAVGCLCVVQFVVGARIGRGQFPIASSLALGRKNTMFAVWIALTFMDPIVALGPMFYIFFQNAFNGWQMWQVDREKKLIGGTSH